MNSRKLLSFVLCSTIIMSNAMEQRPTGRRSRETIARMLAASAAPSMVQVSETKPKRLARASSTVTRGMAETPTERLKREVLEASKECIQAKEIELGLKNAFLALSDKTNGCRDCTALERMAVYDADDAHNRAFNRYWTSKRKLDAIMGRLELAMANPTKTESELKQEEVEVMRRRIIAMEKDEEAKTRAWEKKHGKRSATRPSLDSLFGPNSHYYRVASGGLM